MSTNPASSQACGLVVCYNLHSASKCLHLKFTCLTHNTLVIQSPTRCLFVLYSTAASCRLHLLLLGTERVILQVCAQDPSSHHCRCPSTYTSCTLRWMSIECHLLSLNRYLTFSSCCVTVQKQTTAGTAEVAQ